MALHIQMSEEAEQELRKAARRNKISSMAACLIFMILGGSILWFSVILIAGEEPSAFLAYTQPQEDAPPTNEPTTPELSQKQSAPSSDVAPSLIVATAPAAVAMAQVEMDTTDFESSADFGVGMEMGGLGNGLGSGGSGLGSGKSGGSALEGTFYDLKQTRAGVPSDCAKKTGNKVKMGGRDVDQLDVNRDNVMNVLGSFISSWSPAVLGRYYTSKTKLYASNFVLPSCEAAYAPYAFQCQDRCQPMGMVAIYRGRVRAPKTGKFRFVGVGDEMLAVRFNNKMALEAGWCIPSAVNKVGPGKALNLGTTKEYKDALRSGKDNDHPQYEIVNACSNTADWNKNVGGFIAGTPFDVVEGKEYPIEVMIAEVPGGFFGFCLLIQDVTTPQLKSQGRYDLFRTNFSEPKAQDIQELVSKAQMNVRTAEFPTYNADSPVWVAVP